LVRGSVRSRVSDKLGVSAFYVPPQDLEPGWFDFPPEEEHHLRHVLRLGPGSEVEVLDGCGGRYRVRVERGSGPGRLAGRVLGTERREEPRPFLSVALAVARKERLRVAVEKLAELGCHRIFPFLSDHVSFSGSAGREADKLRLVCRSALKQSRGWFLTRIEEPLAFDSLLEFFGKSGVRPVFCAKKIEKIPAVDRNRMDGAEEFCLVVGPEGGFSRNEFDRIVEGSFPMLHLGEADLRFETAAIAGFSILRSFVRGDFGLY
jgi:16S rRNA (uracil1498-N3)-methyltransferase